MYDYNFGGKRSDIGDKLGFLEATVEYDLRKTEFNDQYRIFKKCNIIKNFTKYGVLSTKLYTQ